MVIRRIPDPTLQQPVKTQFKEPEQKSQIKSILTKIQKPREKPIEAPVQKLPQVKPKPIPEPEPIPEDDDDLTYLDHIPDVGTPVEWDEWDKGYARSGPQKYIPQMKQPEPPKPKPATELFEEAQQIQQRQGSTIVKHESLSESLEKESIPLKNIAGTVIGVLLVAFGIWNSGGFYETSSRLSGDLAVFFYVWQIGNLLQIVGAITTYHNILKLTDYIKKRISKKEQD